MTKDEAKTALKMLLAKGGEQGEGLNEHGQGALQMGPVRILIEHKDEALRLVAPAYFFRGDPDPARVKRVLGAFENDPVAAPLSFESEQAAFCFTGSQTEADVDGLVGLVTELATCAAEFSDTLSTRLASGEV